MKTKPFSFKYVVCQKENRTSFRRQRICSGKCKEDYYKREYIISGKSDYPSYNVGAIAELAVSVDLMKKGFSVFRAVSQASYCDLIAINTTTKVKLELEVRTGYKNMKGVISFPKHLSKYDNGNVTGFAIMDRKTGKIHYYNLENK